jgi:hypothetical protein
MDYCHAIAATLTEHRKLPRLTDDATPAERRHVHMMDLEIHHRGRALQEAAARDFAALNHWRFSPRDFSIKTLIRGGARATRDEYPPTLHPSELLDHAVYFRELVKPYRPAAIVGQPYESAVTVDCAIKLARSLKLVLHVPPVSTASWWFPRCTHFFCLTRPGFVVNFLPDQLAFEAVEKERTAAGEKVP